MLRLAGISPIFFQNDEKSVAVRSLGMRWPDAVVPYIIDPLLAADSVADFRAAVAHYEERTNVRFVERVSQNEALFPNYVSVVRINDCDDIKDAKKLSQCRASLPGGTSAVGMKGGEQFLRVNELGSDTGTLVHEIGHLLGLYHEQSRSDRDEYVTFNPDNVRPGAGLGNFTIKPNGVDIGDYDFESMMHYSFGAFAKAGTNTLDPKVALDDPGAVGSRNTLSDGDIAGLLYLYHNKNIAQFGDYNGDGKQDILWTTRDAGASIWYMDGARPTSSNTLQESGVAGWLLHGSGDFDGNGFDDLLWTTPEGGIATWSVNTDGVVQPAAALGDQGNGWRVVGVGDFNGSGADDLMFMTQQGAVLVWTAEEGNVQVQSEYVEDWRLAGTGDVDGDGKADIVWTRPDGDTAVWYMDGGKIRAQSEMSDGVAGWWIAGIADLNTDARADFVWTNANGGVAYWANDGSTILGSIVVQERGAKGWYIGGLRDFDGDNIAEILWLTPSGGVAIWNILPQLLGGEISSTLVQDAASPGWMVVR